MRASLTLSFVLLIYLNCASAANIAVTTTIDSPINYQTLEADCFEGEGSCSLRAALAAANLYPDYDVILLSQGTYKLTQQGTDEDANNSGDLDIHSSLTLKGAGKDLTFIDGNKTDRILDHHKGVLKIESLTLQNGRIDYDDDDSPHDTGAAMRSRAHIFAIYINDTRIRNNIDKTDVGTDTLDIQFVSGKMRTRLTINNSIIENNGQLSNGSRTLKVVGGTISIKNSVIKNNIGTTSLASERSLYFENNQFTANMANKLGNLTTNHMIEFSSSHQNKSVYLSIKNNIFKDNKKVVSEDFANSLIYIHIHPNNNYSSVVFDNNHVENNKDFYSILNGHVDPTFYEGYPLKITNSTFVNNTPKFGLIYLYGANDKLIENVAIINNHSREIVDITFPKNNIITSKVDIVNTTMSGNVVKQPLINLYYNSTAVITLVNTTIANNKKDESVEDEYNFAVFEIHASHLKLINTILHNPEFDKNCHDDKSFHSLGNNIYNDDNCPKQPSDMPNQDAMLAPLADNGGNTLTHKLLPGSPAINAGAEIVDYDQRGFARPQGGSSDIGAHEVIFFNPIPCDSKKPGYCKYN